MYGDDDDDDNGVRCNFNLHVQDRKNHLERIRADGENFKQQVKMHNSEEKAKSSNKASVGGSRYNTLPWSALIKIYKPISYIFILHHCAMNTFYNIICVFSERQHQDLAARQYVRTTRGMEHIHHHLLHCHHHRHHHQRFHRPTVS